MHTKRPLPEMKSHNRTARTDLAPSLLTSAFVAHSPNAHAFAGTARMRLWGANVSMLVPFSAASAASVAVRRRCGK